MTKTPKKIEFLLIKTEVSKGHKNIKFEDLFEIETIGNLEYHNGDKLHTYQKLTSNKDCLIGLMTTKLKRNIPPKILKDNHSTEALPFTQNEGLGYANIFYYYKEKNVLLYEVNKNGCYPKDLIQFIYNGWNKCGFKYGIDLKIYPLFETDSYRRIMQMKTYRNLEMEFIFPKSIVQDCADKNNAIITQLIESVNTGSERVSYNFSLINRGKKSSLFYDKIKNYITFINQNFMSNENIRKNIQKVEVKGYTTDIEDKDKVDIIDLVGKTIDGSINLTSKQTHDDLQIQERKDEIIKLFNKKRIAINKSRE